jgi:hypothetical protein
MPWWAGAPRLPIAERRLPPSNSLEIAAGAKRQAIPRMPAIEFHHAARLIHR